MIIRFLCPNGHKIHCDGDRAGQPAKCPKCGVKFLVPECSFGGDSGVAFGADVKRGSGIVRKGGNGGALPEESSGSANHIEMGGGFPRGSDASSSGSRSGVRRPTAEEQIEFLCPNGHRLHGPLRLQNKVAECPECGSRFRVPCYDEVPETESSEKLPVIVTDREAPSSPVEVHSDSNNGGPPSSRLQARLENLSLSDSLGPPSTMLDLFSRLWAERVPGVVVEIRLTDGETLVPEHFYRRSSQGPQAVFADEQPDGTFTVTTVAWSAIERIQVRGLNKVPDTLK